VVDVLRAQARAGRGRGASSSSAAQGLPSPRSSIRIDTAAITEPLPALAESDKPLAEGLAAAIDRDAIARYLISQDLVRRIVATVDNLPRKTTRSACRR
jgi:hypothetical protein